MVTLTCGRDVGEHYKSTIITFAGIIQEILRDPEIPVVIFSHTKPTARKFFNQIKQELETNEELKGIYPDVLYAEPKKESPRWSEEKGIVVKRTTNPKEATVEAHGLVDGQPTGGHWRLRVYDDTVTLESVSTPEQVNKTTAAWELSDNLGARDADGNLGRAWHVGTRYSFMDTYQVIIDRGALKVRLYAATDTGLPEGNPVLLTPEAWAQKKLTQGPATIACQMLQNPAAGNEAMFKKEWLSFIDIRPATLNVYIMVDPASSKKKASDNTAMAVVGIDAGGNKYLLDGFRHKMNLRERWEAMRGLRRIWQAQPGVQLVKVGYERYGLQSDLEYFEECMQREKDAFDIVELNWTAERVQAKDDRVQRLVPDFASKRFYMAAITPGETANQRRIREQGQSYRIFKPVAKRDHEGNLYRLNAGFLEEYLTYPFSSKKDLIDATSRIYDMEPVPPILVDESALEPVLYEDGV
jgi:phage terminase large subunit-like protein